MADRLIGKAGSEEAKWDFTDAFQKSWIPKLRLWHGYIYTFNNIYNQTGLTTSGIEYQQE